jgi:hypothetical protein
MPITRAQIKELETIYYKIQDAVPRDPWREYIAELESQEGSHRGFIGGSKTRHGMTKPVAVKLLAVLNIFEFLLGDCPIPTDAKEYFNHTRTYWLGAIICAKWGDKIKESYFTNTSNTSPVDMRYFLDRFDYAKLNAV